MDTCKYVMKQGFYELVCAGIQKKNYGRTAQRIHRPFTSILEVELQNYFPWIFSNKYEHQNESFFSYDSLVHFFQSD